MTRRTFIAAMSALGTATTLLDGAEVPKQGSRFGVCSFSCNQQWAAVQAKHPGVKFTDTISFYRYARGLGAQGVQTSLHSRDPAVAHELRALVEKDGGYFEGELHLPHKESEVDAFDEEVRLLREAGASVARAYLMVGRRYEFFKTLEDFKKFHAQAEQSLVLAEPVLRKHRLALAVENHKDLLYQEQVALIRKISSEWIGVLVDSGNNLSLLEDPYETVVALAPLARSVHFKDMAVQSYGDGFLLSEVVLGEGFLDLQKIVDILVKANPTIVFNLEMATRDPLRVPCKTDAYWTTFPERRATHLQPAMERVKANPIKQPVPPVAGKSKDAVLAEEEANNRACLKWMASHLQQA